MRIAVSATGPDLDAEVDPRFGRCQYFIIVDPQTMEFEAVENTSAMASGGAGIASAQMVANKGVQAVLTGRCGPNAYQTLAAAGVQVVSGVAGRVRDAIEGYKSGQFKPASQPSAEVPFGMGPGTGTGRGIGGGLAMGRGVGRGMGMGRGMGWRRMPMAGPTPQPASLEQDVEVLKQHTRTLRQQLEEVERRIDRLEHKAD